MSYRLVASESQTQKAILDWLAAQRILAFRRNVGVHEVEGRKVRYGVPGEADIEAFPVQGGYIMPTWIEVKAIKGKQSELQKSFQAQVESHGHRYVIARRLEDVQEALRWTENRGGPRGTGASRWPMQIGSRAAVQLACGFKLTHYPDLFLRARAYHPCFGQGMYDLWLCRIHRADDRRAESKGEVAGCAKSRPIRV